MSNFEQQLEEAMGFGSYMDVDELRTLYYGRLGIHIAFSDNADIPKSGFLENKLAKPWSITAHTIDAVIGRKASTHYYYGHVFRVRKTGLIFLEDIKSYNSEHYNEDVEVLRSLPYIDPEALEEAIQTISSNPRHRLPFSRLWALTQALSATKGKYGDKYWRRLLLDLGYRGFNDPQGTGVIGKRNQQVTILLEFDLEEFDIVPVQKYRKDKRRRIIQDVNKKNKRNHARRNRVAKHKTDPFREEDGLGKKLLKTLTLGAW